MSTVKIAAIDVGTVSSRCLLYTSLRKERRAARWDRARDSRVRGLCRGGSGGRRAFDRRDGCGAVSYTHLDVYKRQATGLCEAQHHEGGQIQGERKAGGAVASRIELHDVVVCAGGWTHRVFGERSTQAENAGQRASPLPGRHRPYNFHRTSRGTSL